MDVRFQSSRFASISLAKLVLSLCSFLVAVTAPAQTAPPETTRVLLPVVLLGTDGAFGALWKTELWLRNNAPRSVYIFPYDPGCVPVPVCVQRPTAPGATFQPQAVVWGDRGNIQGTFLHVEKGFVDQVSLQLRVRNLRNELKGFGTELPVVSEDEFRSDRIVLLDLPVRPEYRATLRAYSLDPVVAPAVIVRVYGLSDDTLLPPPRSPLPQLLSEQRYTLQSPPSSIRESVPDYLQLDLDPNAFAPWRQVMLEIIPATEGMRIWSFASVTNNVTQQITAITPQPGRAKGE